MKPEEKAAEIHNKVLARVGGVFIEADESEQGYDQAIRFLEAMLDEFRENNSDKNLKKGAKKDGA